MIELQTTPPEQMSELLTADGQLDEKALESIKLRNTATIRDLLDAPNRITLSRPECFDLIALSATQGVRLSPMIASQGDRSDFWAVHWACTFRPSPTSEFVRASVAVQLELTPPTPNSEAVAYDMFPRDVKTPITVKRGFTISPEIQFKFGEIAEASAKVGSAERASEYALYEPQISAFALGESTPGWDFERTKGQAVRGVKELYLLVKKPKGNALWGRFKLSAAVQTNVGRIALSTFFLSGGRKPVIDERYRLAP